MGPVFAILMMIAFVALIWFAISSANEQRRRRLREFANRLEGGRLTVDPSGLGNEDTHIHGRRNGWGVSLSHSRTPPNQQHYVLRYAVDVPFATSGFEVTKTHALNRLGRWLGFTPHQSIGNSQVDDKYVLNGSREALGRLFQSGGMERALDHLFTLGFVKVTLEQGLLEVQRVYQHPDQVKAEQLDQVFGALIRVAQLCRRRKIRVTLSERPTVRFGWTAGTQQILCPYCRDSIDPATEGLSACNSCQTVHHEACLIEARRCTIFGCDGEGQRRVSA